MRLFKKQPDDNWLIDLDKYRIKEKPKGRWDCKGPWYSDDGEDGVLAYLFEYINPKHNFAVDIGATHGYGGSHVRHLTDKYKWGSTEIEGYPKSYWKRIHSRINKERISPGNLCEILSKYKTPKRFDLLSLDIDSMDWYVIEQLLENNYKPSIAIIEFNPIFNHDEAYVVKYNPKYKKDGTSRYGASARAFEVLMNKHNYTLIHLFPQTTANNLLFILNDYITPTMNINTLQNLHPQGYVEKHKQKINESRGLTKGVIRKSFKKIDL